MHEENAFEWQPSVDTAPAGPPGLNDPPARPQVGHGLVSLALILPIVVGIAQCFIDSMVVGFLVGFAMVIVTGTLVTVDASRLGRVDQQGRFRESPALLFLGMLVIWIIAYPAAFFRRSSFTRPNLGPVALVVAIASCLTPIAASLLIPVGLPECDSTEVVQLLQQIVQSSPLGATARSIDGHRELSYNPNTNVRSGECTVHLDSGDVPLQFFVEWKDREAGIFQVRLPQPELPSCNGPDVVRVLNESVRSLPMGADITSIDGFREVNYDRGQDVRIGECILHTNSGDIPYQFIVEWQDREQGMFQVRPANPELPGCTSQEVVALLDEVIRKALPGATINSIDGHRELSYDPHAMIRQGECIVHLDSEDIPVRFIVEWKDMKTGLFFVRIADEPI